MTSISEVLFMVFFHIGTAFIHGCCAVDGIKVDFFILYVFFERDKKKRAKP